MRQRLAAEDAAQELDHRRLVGARPPLAERHEIRPAEAVEQVATNLHLLRTEHEMAAVARFVDLVEGRAAGGALVLRVGLAAASTSPAPITLGKAASTA